ncbi:protein of unknown function [Magnetospirillum sp. XM-1]|uniref:class I SAM-dependent methyltransferase n=1 Tax=Magnetospirillum sp. XM-1 TaxID=1663591 RepID=UPI00073E061B|nr:class I SAM-dependent methyltransferase [Magnetospirillum sp. XM-1]CUW38078.1 protein of unknown function [Magnetospirillum sp. XM-1]
METRTQPAAKGMAGTLPPARALLRPKPLGQQVIDLLGAPLRMVVLPDLASEQLGLTSLRCERFSAVLPQMRGRCLDVGAGDNVLLRLYESGGGPPGNVGVDVVDWGGGCVLVPSADRLPFADASFDTVTFVACLNHIVERAGALAEAHRVLRPGGRVVLTMIGRTLGELGHRLWWYSEDKHREEEEGETGGLNPAEMIDLLGGAGFVNLHQTSFVYGLNRLYVAERASTR